MKLLQLPSRFGPQIPIKAFAVCVDPQCPFQAVASTPEQAYVKLEAHVRTFHPEFNQPSGSAA